MSRSTKWNLEKTKVKVVFRLQFHATQIPQSGWDKLFVSLIPSDSGKVTAKTNKANVRNGICKWADPIYETTKLLQDAITKQYEEKLYKLIVATGSSRSSLLGEANINLGDYADASKPTAVTLPLHGSDAGAVLNVTVQLLTSKTGFREFEQQRELSERRLQTTSNHDAGKTLTSREYSNSLLSKVNARVKFKREPGELPSLEEANLNEECQDLVSGLDDTSNTSGSLYAEKNDASSAHEIDSIKSTVSGDFGGLSLSQSPSVGKEDSSTNHFVTPGTSDWLNSWGSDPSVDNELGIVYEENSRLRASLEVAELSINELKLAINTLQGCADDISAETHKLTEELAAEIASGQGLAKEVSFLKSECERMKGNVEWLRNSNTVNEKVLKESSEVDQHCFLHGSLSLLEGLHILEDKIRELQSKAYLAFHETNFRFLVTDLGALVSIIHDLKQGCFSSRLAVLPAGSVLAGRINERSFLQANESVSGTSFGLDMCHPEDVLHCISVPEPASHEISSTEATAEKHGGLFKLLCELDESKAEREALVTKMDQMECYYEALIQELEETQKRVLGEYQNIRNEHSGCNFTISSTKAQMEVMHQGMSEKISRLEKERCELDSFNKELERRAITSEAALRRFKLNYSIAVNQLQKDLETLSFQVLSMYETNENFIRKAFSEALQPCFQGYPDAIWRENVDTRDSNISKLMLCQNLSVGAKSPLLGGEGLLDDLKKSLTLQEELYREIEEELYDNFCTNVQLDVFTQTLQHSLLETTAKVRLEKESLYTVMELLGVSTKSNELLKTELQTAANSISVLTADKAIFVAKCNDLTQQNQIWEAKCRSLYGEISELTQKTAEREAMVIECETYKSSYEACNADRKHLASLLEHSSLENDKLSDKNILLQEELSAVKTELYLLASSKESLQKMVDSLKEELETFSASYGVQFQLSLSDKSLALPELEHDNFVGIISWLEEVQHTSFEIIHQLMQEKKVLEDELNLAQFSLSTVKHEAEVVKQKFEREVPDMVLKFDASNALVDKFQEDLEDIGSRLKLCTEAEATFAVVNEELSSNLARMEVEVKELTLKNGDLLQQILALRSVSEELDRSKLIVAELTQNKEDLSTSLQNKADETALLNAELNYLKGSLRSLNDLLVEKGFRDLLHETPDLDCRFNEKRFNLLDFQQHVTEVIHLKQMVSDLQVEKYSLSHQLSQLDESQRQSLADSSVAEMNSRAMQESLLAADVNLAFFRMQYKCHIQELLQQLESRDRHLQDLNKKHLNLETMLNECVATKAKYVRENERSLSTFESLKSELQISIAEKKALEDGNSDLAAELEECKIRCTVLDGRYTEDRSKQKFMIEQLRLQLASCHEEIDSLTFSNQELEIWFIVLKAKLDEHCALTNLLQRYNDEFTRPQQQCAELNHRLHEEIDSLIFSYQELEILFIILKAKLDEHCSLTNLLQGYNDEYMRLQQQCDELNHRLCEQTFKMEEFRNLSIHLKELKDKAEEECLQASQKREAEGMSFAKHESLRIAFIKEQYESKLQELRHQLSISKKHGEEMLWKLQDAVDQLEKIKKSEASQMKRNDEMSLRMSTLEAELCSVLSDNREKANVYDQVKTELECLLISLECCKEEKQKLMDSLHQCNEEKSRIEAQFSWMRETYVRSTASMKSQLESKHESCRGETFSIEKAVAPLFLEIESSTSIGRDVSDATSVRASPLRSRHKCAEDIGPKESVPENGILVSEDGGEHARVTSGTHFMQDALLSRGAQDPLEWGHNGEEVLENGAKDAAYVSSELKARSLICSIDYLHNELEKMKIENSDHLECIHPFESNSDSLQRELSQLEKVNKELGNVSPVFNELPSSGDSIGRVLALELELADALQAKKKTAIQFQSSFLKQVTDEAAVLQSFRDINDLIKEMLEMKARYGAKDMELKEMHERYSQLSLQFAEVEGERQKLMMALKNVRASKRLLSRSSSATPP
ncbi:hypothetical protein Dimus_005252 [Dionaea muscipula]